MVGASITDGWETFKRNPWLLIGALVLYSLITGALNTPGNSMMEDGRPTMASGLWSTLAWLATFPLMAGASYLALRLVRGESGMGIETLFAGYKRYLPLLGAYLLYYIIVGIGLILLVVPGIIAALGLMQAPLLVLDKGLGPTGAVKGSWEMMKGYKMDAFLLALASFLIVILGAIALLVGLLVAIPVITAAGSAFYFRVLALNPPPQLGSTSPIDSAELV